MSSEHFIKLCKCCARVITQCRCPSENKKIVWDICDNCKNLSEPTINNLRANEMSKCYTIKPLDFDYENGYSYTGMYEEWTAKSPIGKFQIDVNTSDTKKFELIKWIDEEVGSYLHIGYFTSFAMAVDRANEFLLDALEPYLDEAGF